MDGLFKWLLTSGNQLTAGGILIAGFTMFVVAIYREWFVTGKSLHQCQAENEKFKTEATKRALDTEQRVLELEAELRETRDGRRK